MKPYDRDWELKAAYAADKVFPGNPSARHGYNHAACNVLRTLAECDDPADAWNVLMNIRVALISGERVEIPEYQGGDL